MRYDMGKNLGRVSKQVGGTQCACAIGTNKKFPTQKVE